LGGGDLGLNGRTYDSFRPRGHVGACVLLVPVETGGRLNGVGEGPGSFRLAAEVRQGMPQSLQGGPVIGAKTADRSELGRGQRILASTKGDHSVVEQLVREVIDGGVLGETGTTGWAVGLLHRHGLGTQRAVHPGHVKSLPAS